MSIFKKLLNLVTKEDDEIAQETDGILSGNSMILDTNTGTLHARPNIPKISLTPTISESYGKSLDFLSGNRTPIRNPVNPLQPQQDTGQVNAEAQTPLEGLLKQNPATDTIPDNLSDDMATDDPNETSSLHEVVYGTGKTPHESGGYDHDAMRKAGVIPIQGRNPANNNPADKSSIANMLGGIKGLLGDDAGSTSVKRESRNGVQTPLKDPETGEVLPDIPILKDLPDKSSAKNSPKWKDILVGVLNNISKTDFSKVPEEQRTAAFLGAMAGGGIQGAGTGRFAGKLEVENERQRIEAENQKTLKTYEQQMDLRGKRVNIQNASLKPELERAKIANVEFANKIKEQATQGKITNDEANFRVKMMQIAQKDKQFTEKLKQYKTWKTVQNADGSFGLIGIKADNSSEPVKMSDGSLVTMPDPSAWARTLEDIRATQLEEVAKLEKENPNDRRAYIDNKVDMQLQKEGLTDPTSKKTLKRKAELNQQYAADYDSANRQNRKVEEVGAKARGARKGLKRNPPPNGRKGRSNVSVPATVQGIDFKTMWKNRQSK